MNFENRAWKWIIDLLSSKQYQSGVCDDVNWIKFSIEIVALYDLCFQYIAAIPFAKKNLLNDSLLHKFLFLLVLHCFCTLKFLLSVAQIVDCCKQMLGTIIKMHNLLLSCSPIRQNAIAILVLHTKQNKMIYSNRPETVCLTYEFDCIASYSCGSCSHVTAGFYLGF